MAGLTCSPRKPGQAQETQSSQINAGGSGLETQRSGEPLGECTSAATAASGFSRRVPWLLGEPRLYLSPLCILSLASVSQHCPGIFWGPPPSLTPRLLGCQYGRTDPAEVSSALMIHTDITGLGPHGAPRSFMRPVTSLLLRVVHLDTFALFPQAYSRIKATLPSTQPSAAK